MKQARNDNEEPESQSDDNIRRVGFGWQGRFGFHLTGLSQGDVKCIAVAIALAILLIALSSLAFGFTLVWDRVSLLWQ